MTLNKKASKHRSRGRIATHRQDNATAAAGGDAAASNSTGSAAAGDASAKNQTNVVGALRTADIIIRKAPYELKSCDQVIFLTAETIKDWKDYTTRKPAFFTMSAYLINVFESEDSNKLIDSINLGHITVLPQLLLGSKNCLAFYDSYSARNVSMCISDGSTLDQIQQAYNNFMSCRAGGDLNEFDPVTINNVIGASCNGFNNTSGLKFDLPAIKAKFQEELKKQGFEVNEQTTNGAGAFGVVKSQPSNATNIMAAPPRRRSFRVPGTPVIRNEKLFVWD